MSTLTKDQVKEIVRGNNFESIEDISTYLKEIFKDLIQEMMEATIETSLGYAKSDIKNKETDNSRIWIYQSSNYIG
jgi:putative transposase